MTKLDKRNSYYNRDYYLTACEGAALWKNSAGGEVDLLHRQVLSLANLKPNERVLDFGCGRGELSIQAALLGCTVAAMDASTDALSLLREALDSERFKGTDVPLRIDLIQKPFQDAGFKDQSFDVILMADVVEHLWPEELELAFRFSKRWLKRDGRIIIHTMPTLEFVSIGQYVKYFLNKIQLKDTFLTSLENEANNTHVNIQTKEKLVNLLKKTGFQSIEVWYEFSNPAGFLKKILRGSGLHRWLAHNLWGIAKNPNQS